MEETPQDWEDAKRMEKDRKEGVASLPARPGAHMANECSPSRQLTTTSDGMVSVPVINSISMIL